MSWACTEGNFKRFRILKLLEASPLFVQVLGKETEESAAFELDLTSLRQVLAGEHISIYFLLIVDVRDVFCDPRVADLPACVLSVAGAMRTGKSFLLDQMVRLLLLEVGW